MNERQEVLRARCCIAGGGPAGMMLGLLLARAGVDVMVLEKHADFLRDFRGDTIHPSTLEVMHELGLLDGFLERPHQELREIKGWIGDAIVPIADFSHLPTRCKFIAFMPQWEFLDFLASRAARSATFRLRTQAEVTDVIEENARIIGVRARTPTGPLEVRAELTIGADGRHSTVRDAARLEIMNIGAPMDVLWMKVSQRPGDPKSSLGRFDAGHILALIDRRDYWQCAFVIPKGTFEEIRRRGLPAFRDELARLVPFLADRVGELADWNDIKLLTVAVDRLRQWSRPGLLWRRHQPGNPGRGRRRKHSRRTAAARLARARAFARGAATARMADPIDARHASADSEPGHPSRARPHRSGPAPAAVAAAARLPRPAAHPRPPDRHRLPARARAHAR